MNQTALRLLLLASLPSLIACGIPKDQHEAVIADRNACQTQLAEREKALLDKDKSIADRDQVLQDKERLLADADARLKAQGSDLQELAALRKQKAAAEARAKLFDDLVAKLKSAIDTGKVAVSIRRGQIVLALNTDVLFDPGKTVLKKEGQNELREVSKALQTLANRRFQIAGHTDNVPIKTAEFPSNWELSTARAVEVVKLLIKEGVKETMISAAGFAEFDPTDSNATPQTRAKNRRIEIILVPNVEELGLKELGSK
ncbi:MAG: OmpA family protein [Polyangiaceae bacterium]|nr:OmpA family protein [Polyangiaceae bacterium]